MMTKYIPLFEKKKRIKLNEKYLLLFLAMHTNITTSDELILIEFKLLQVTSHKKLSTFI